MTPRPAILAALMPFLTVALMLWSASCSRAQMPPEPQWSWRSLLVWQVPMPQEPVRLSLEGQIPAHWCQQKPENIGVAFYSSTDLQIWTWTGTNVVTASKPHEFFIAVHFCSESNWEQIPIRFTKL